MNIFKPFIVIMFSIQIFSTEIFVNQVGYLPNLPKYFYTAEQVDSFYIIEESTGTIYYTGKVELSVTNDPGTGLTLYKGDFSELEKPGNYFVQLNNGDSSFIFKISSDVFQDAANKSLKSFYYQRCGVELPPDFAGVYHHPACHLNDGTLHSNTGESGYLENKGGWHDAGDYGKYVVNAGITVGTLLMAYEYFSDGFDSDNLNIPESGNNIPDILDEIRFELEWLLKMQKPDGGVYFKLTRETFEGFIMPQNDDGTRYIYEISSTATGNFAAVMARASRLFISYDSTFANQCLNAAISAWKFLITHPGIIPGGGFKNPPGTRTGEYGNPNDKDERLWASAELFETTGDSLYHNYFINHYNNLGIIKSIMNWGNVQNLAYVTYLWSKQSAAPDDIKSSIKNNLVSYCDSLVKRSNVNGFGITLNPGEYHWGCNSDVLNNAILLILGYEQSNRNDFYNTAIMQLYYILGSNAHNKCFVTGLGSNPVMFPHHRPSASDEIIDPVPGLIAGGPNQDLQDRLLQANYNNSTPPALCYLDDVGSYASNENAINWNAPLVFVLGYFNSEGLFNGEDKE